MDSTLYNRIKEYKKTGNLPEFTSRWAELRFKNHYDQNWIIKDNKLYFQGVDDILIQLYKNPNTTSNGLHSFFDIVKQRYYGITFNQVRDFLKNCESYQLHKPVQAIKVIKPIIKSQPGVYIQANTINLTEYSYFNNSFSYALTCGYILKKIMGISVETQYSQRVF
jgi:hypothetical protein